MPFPLETATHAFYTVDGDEGKTPPPLPAFSGVLSTNAEGNVAPSESSRPLPAPFWREDAPFFPTRPPPLLRGTAPRDPLGLPTFDDPPLLPPLLPPDGSPAKLAAVR